MYRIQYFLSMDFDSFRIQFSCHWTNLYIFRNNYIEFMVVKFTLSYSPYICILSIVNNSLYLIRHRWTIECLAGYSTVSLVCMCDHGLQYIRDVLIILLHLSFIILTFLPSLTTGVFLQSLTKLFCHFNRNSI